MDQTDLALSIMLLQNCRVPYRELADRLGMSVNAVHKRIQALMEAGMIRGFRARPSLFGVRGVQVLVWGYSNARTMAQVRDRLSRSDHTYWVGTGSGNHLYVGGYLRDIGEMEAFSTFVKREGEVPDPTVGIVTMPPVPVPMPAELTPLDFQIIAALSKNARKAVSEVSEEIGVSAKTVGRRLDAMIEHQLIELTIEWYPDASDDIIALFDVEVEPSVDRVREIGALSAKFAPNVLFFQLYANLPNLMSGWMWASTMKKMKEISDQMEQAEGVARSVPNIIYSGVIFDTWRDTLAQARARRPAHHEGRDKSQ